MAWFVKASVLVPTQGAIPEKGRKEKKVASRYSKLGSSVIRSKINL